jgi:predicted PurR-regulated permease PerM
MVRSPDSRSRIAFYILFAGMGILMFWLVRAYLGVIAFAFVAVIILKPLYNGFLRLCKGWEKVAMTLTLFVGLALPLLLLWIVGSLVATQIYAFIDVVQHSTNITFLTESFTTYIRPFFTMEAPLAVDLLAQLHEVAIAALSRLAGSLVNLGMAIPTFLVDLFVFVILVGALLPNYDRFVQWLERLSPLDDTLEELFLRKIATTIQSMFVGIFLIAIVQGLALGFFFWLVSVPYTSLWTLAAILMATLPLGASVVAVPVAVVQFLAGNVVEGTIVLAGYLLVVSNLDLLIRTKLASQQAYGHFALMLLSLLGGYQLFGVFGVFYGPVLMVLFLTTLDVYQEYYAPKMDSENKIFPSAQGVWEDFID